MTEKNLDDGVRVDVVPIGPEDVFFVRTEGTLPAERYHEIREKLEADLRHAGIDNPHVVVWPPHLTVSILSPDVGR